MFGLEEEKSFEQRLIELEAEHENLKRGRQAILDELEVSPEQIKENLKPENLPEELKIHLAEQKQKLDEALNKSISAIVNPKKAEKTRSEQKTVDNRWLFVR